ncbi:unnamed protein product [Pylaiella littoralis]
MKFGKKIRTELSPGQLRGSVNYKALKKIAKKLRRGAGGGTGVVGCGLTDQQQQQQHHNHHQQQQQQEHGVEEFFARLEAEKDKVAEFYRSREAWCFVALESTRGALFGLTRRASKERLSLAVSASAVATPFSHEQNAAGELEGKFLEAKAGATVLLSESRDLVQFVDMNMHAFRKLLKKLDKWTSGVSGREYFTSMVQNTPWINGDRAHGVLRMASAMSDHLRSLRPALALGPAAGGPCWADRIVYSVGTFDRPRLSTEPNTTNDRLTTMTSVSPVDDGGIGGIEFGDTSGINDGYDDDEIPRRPGEREEGGGGYEAAAAAAAAKEAVEGPSPLRFMREFGAVVVVGVFTDAAHAASNHHHHRGGGGGSGYGYGYGSSNGNGGNNLNGGGGGGNGGGTVAGGWPMGLRGGGGRGERGPRPDECLEARCARVRPYADRVVVVDSADPARVREILFGAAAGAVGVGAPTNNCCFVVCDWGMRGPGGTEAGRRARRDVRALMEASMPVFRLPSPAWECAVTGGGKEEEEEEEEQEVQRMGEGGGSRLAA